LIQLTLSLSFQFLLRLSKNWRSIHQDSGTTDQQSSFISGNAAVEHMLEHTTTWLFDGGIVLALTIILQLRSDIACLIVFLGDAI
jgi:hypothetical protein